MKHEAHGTHSSPIVVEGVKGIEGVEGVKSAGAPKKRCTSALAPMLIVFSHWHWKINDLESVLVGAEEKLTCLV